MRRACSSLPARGRVTLARSSTRTSSLLSAPTVAELQKAVHGTLVSGDAELVGREAMSVLVAGMTADHVLERLRDAMARTVIDSPLGPFQFTPDHDVRQTIWIIAMDGHGGFSLVTSIKPT